MIRRNIDENFSLIFQIDTIASQIKIYYFTRITFLGFNKPG